MINVYFSETPQVATVAPEQNQSQYLQIQQQNLTALVSASASTSQVTSIPRTPTTDWAIEDVIAFISASDPTLAIHSDLFRRHVSFNNSIYIDSILNKLFLFVYLLGNRW